MTQPYGTVDALSPDELVRQQQRALLSADPGGFAASDAPNISPAIDPNTPPIADYWSGPPADSKWYFPDGVQWISFLPLNHGMRARFSARTNKEMTLDRKSGNAKIKTDMSGDTDALLDISITGWYLLRNGVPQSFNKTLLSQFLQQAHPEIVDSLEKAIRKVNPWMDSEVTVDQIDEQIKELTELRAERVAEAEKK